MRGVAEWLVSHGGRADRRLDLGIPLTLRPCLLHVLAANATEARPASETYRPIGLCCCKRTPRRDPAKEILTDLRSRDPDYS